MAIQFTSGTINQPDAGSVGLSTIEQMRDDIVAHVAWDLVEEYNPGSISRWYVFKCLASQSGLPADFFVCIQRTLGDGSLRGFICEGYNSTTHVASFYAPYAYNSQFSYNSSGQAPQTYTLIATTMGSLSTHPYHHGWAPSGTSTKWWLTVDNDGFTVAFNGASNGYMNFGAYIPLSTLPNAMPICSMGSTTLGAVTRNPAIASLANVYAAALQFNPNPSGGFEAPYLGVPSDLRYNDALQGGQRPVAELAMTTYKPMTGAGDMQTWGHLLGKQKRVRAGNQNSPFPTGFAFGDAFVIQGRLWTPYDPADSYRRMWDTGVASA